MKILFDVNLTVQPVFLINPERFSLLYLLTKCVVNSMYTKMGKKAFFRPKSHLNLFTYQDFSVTKMVIIDKFYFLNKKYDFKVLNKFGFKSSVYVQLFFAVRFY